MPDWQKHGYASYEAWIESKAGANPPELDTCQSCGAPVGEPYCGDCDWPFPRVDVAGDEDQETPTDA